MEALKLHMDARGILSDKQIVHEYTQKNIVITDFRDENLGNCSYDVTLGKHYYKNISPRNSIYNPYSESCIKTWQLCEATTAKEWEELNPVYKFGSTDTNSTQRGVIKDEDLLVWLEPRETILAHTQEFIGAKQNITTMMKARSSIGRSFLEVCKCAGLGDIGYINRWTMEITNNSDYYIPLIVGSRIAQIVFFYTGECFTSYEKKKSAKYQKEYASIQDMQQAWKPEHMLPRLYLDKHPRL